MKDFLGRLGIREVNSGACHGAWLDTKGDDLVSICPADGKPIAAVRQATEEDYESVVVAAHEAFLQWRMLPAPKRGEIVRQMGEALREKKEDLGRLVSYEMGKILSEGLGEVQEAIDIADFAVGLSRQLYGLTMHSERPLHRMYEQWHPLGPIGIVSAFNFPVAVWAWNAMIAAVCGDTMIWKPSSQTPLCAIATQNVMNEVLDRNGFRGVMTLVIGRGSIVGERMIQDRRIPLVSATGSCRMGRRIGEAVAKRLGRTILELGGNNGIIVDETADLDMAIRAILFGAVGTAGQRCTTTRRIFAHKKVYDSLVKKLVAAYRSVPIGDPLDEKTLMGPLVNAAAVETMEKAIAEAVGDGGKVLAGGKKKPGPGFFVEPTIIEGRPDMKIVREETFAPILYVFPYDDLDQAIASHNGVDQGLSSAIFTKDLLHAETFLSHRGSDCGIANVNIGTSGAEIGGAFGGEKDTGGGREAGSDSWKAYMRRQTCTINWGKELPLAQGVRFDLQ
ncbi:MAG: aldehyde dehydrogenase family protein [Candidatus Eisenbacteria bacterium]